MKPLFPDIRARLEKATPGPWESSRDLMTFNIWKREPHTDVCDVGPCTNCNAEDHDDETFHKRWATADFITSSPTDIARLLKAVDLAVEALKTCIEYLDSTDICKLNCTPEENFHIPECCILKEQAKALAQLKELSEEK